ncbi:MAG: hypothetical protein U0232_09225 [Thermomicrobiales bacterium]
MIKRAVADRDVDGIEGSGQRASSTAIVPAPSAMAIFRAVHHQAHAPGGWRSRSRPPGGVEIDAVEVDGRAEAAHLGDFERIGGFGGEDVERMLRLRAAKARPCPKLPADAQTSGVRSSPSDCAK